MAFGRFSPEGLHRKVRDEQKTINYGDIPIGSGRRGRFMGTALILTTPVIFSGIVFMTKSKKEKKEAAEKFRKEHEEVPSKAKETAREEWFNRGRKRGFQKKNP